MRRLTYSHQKHRIVSANLKFTADSRLMAWLVEIHKMTMCTLVGLILGPHNLGSSRALLSPHTMVFVLDIQKKIEKHWHHIICLSDQICFWITIGVRFNSSFKSDHTLSNQIVDSYPIREAKGKYILIKLKDEKHIHSQRL